MGFGRGNAIKDGLSLKDDKLNEMAARSTFRYLNDATPAGQFTSLIGNNTVQSNIKIAGTWHIILKLCYNKFTEPL